MERVRGWFLNLSALVGLVGPSFLVAWYFYSLDGRISTLEGQMKAFAISPAIVGPSDGSAGQQATVPKPFDCYVCGFASESGQSLRSWFGYVFG